jgi:hypothetical protein
MLQLGVSHAWRRLSFTLRCHAAPAAEASTKAAGRAIIFDIFAARRNGSIARLQELLCRAMAAPGSTKVMHGCGQDVAALRRGLGLQQVCGVLDTQVGAAGWPRGWQGKAGLVCSSSHRRWHVTQAQKQDMHKLLCKPTGIMHRKPACAVPIHNSIILSI